MQPSSPGNRQRAASNQNLKTVLALGFGGSVILHLGLIAGITYWWQPSAEIDEPIEITLVEPVDVEPVPPSPPPIKLKPIPTPISTPVKPISKPIPIAIKPPKPIAAKPTPKSSPIPAKPIAKPTPKSSPIPAKLITKPLSTPIVNPTFPPENPRPIAPPKARRPFKSATFPRKSFTNNSKPPSQTDSSPIPAKSTPSPSLPTTTSHRTPPLTQKTKDNQPPNYPSRTGKNPSEDSNPNDRQGEPPSRDRAVRSLSPGNGDRFNRSNSGEGEGGKQGNQNTSDSGSGKDEGDRSGNSPPSNHPQQGTTSQPSSGGGGLECIQYCQIPKLQDLQDRDGGKDRLRIRIVVDANGLVQEGSIAKSSGNPQIDEIVLKGIKQMQFKPTGKVIKGLIKANILL